MVMKKRKYPQKLFLTYSAIVLAVVILLLLGISVVLYREQYKKSAETQLQLASKTSEQLDTSLQGMDRIINGLLFNKTFLQIMKGEDESLYYTDNSKHVLNSFAALDAPLFPSFRIIAYNDTSYYNQGKAGEDPGYIKSALENYHLRDSIDKADGEKVIFPPHQDTFDAQASYVYSVARTITDGKSSYGFIEVQNLYEQLAEYCALDASMGSLIVFSEQGELIYPLGEDAPEDSFLQSLHSEIAAVGRGTGSIRLGGQHVSYTTSAYSGWTTTICIPATQVVPFGFELIGLTLLVFALIAFSTVLLVRYVTKRLTSPLVNLTQALSQVSIENLSLTLPDDNNIEEIEHINDSFQIMFTHLKEAIAKNVQARANEERANYLALQSQMNPHTLYNTIGLIEGVSYMYGYDEISNLCLCFSSMLRYISDYNKRDYTVQDELQHLKNYAVLIEKRYEGKLSIVVEVDEGLEDKLMPKFTLQPLVENAVLHGYGERKTLEIRVAIQRFPSGWRIVVQDDGCGFSDESLERVNQQLAECDESLQANSDYVKGRIGNLALGNIYIRCRIMYGEKFKFTIGKTAGNLGTTIEMLIEEPEEPN